jgi:hypothetical protein
MGFGTGSKPSLSSSVKPEPVKAEPVSISKIDFGVSGATPVPA